MGLIAKTSGGGDFELAPTGNHIARCYMVCDLGMKESTYNGETSMKHKVRIAFELPNEPMADGRPFSVSNNYTLSLHDKATMRKDLVSWRGRQFTDEELEGFDLMNVVGVPCMLNVIHNQSGDKTYANIGSIGPLPKGMDCPAAVNQPVKFSLEDGNWQEVFATLDEWLQKMINNKPQAADEYEQYAQTAAPAGDNFDDFDSDIPF